MNDRDRLEQLRALLMRLERMPVSAERDWMLGEVRARAVDVETGVKPAALRARSEDAPHREIPAAPKPSRIAAAATVPPVQPGRTPATWRPTSPAAPASPAVPATPAHPASLASLASPASLAPSALEPSLAAAPRRTGHDSAVDLLEQGGELCLDDRPAPAGGASRPWSGGLRG